MKSFLAHFTLLGIVLSAYHNCRERKRDPVLLCRGCNHGHCDFETSSSRCSTRTHTKSRHRSHNLTEKEYVHTVVSYLEAKYWKNERPCSKRDVKDALGHVYKMLYGNIHGLIVFTSHVIFNTGGLLKLQAGKEKWASRGILQITGKKNYEKIAEITESDYFLHHPHMLATLGRRAVEGSVLFWFNLLGVVFENYEDAEISFWETLLLLNPSEVRSSKDPESKKRIRNRKAVYRELCEAFKPDLGAGK